MVETHFPSPVSREDPVDRDRPARNSGFGVSFLSSREANGLAWQIPLVFPDIDELCLPFLAVEVVERGSRPDVRRHCGTQGISYFSSQTGLSGLTVARKGTPSN